MANIRPVTSTAMMIATAVVYPLFGPACMALVLAVPLALIGTLTMGPGGLAYYLYLGIWWMPMFYAGLVPPFACAGIFVAVAGRLAGRTSLGAALAAFCLGFLAYLAIAFLVTGGLSQLVVDAEEISHDLGGSPGSVLLILPAAAVCWYISRPVNRLIAEMSGRGNLVWTRGSLAEAGATCIAGAALAAVLAVMPETPQTSQAAWEDCTGGTWDDRMTGCTTIIERPDTESAERRAIAHVRRGEAVRVADRDIGGAIADFSAAIELDPANAEAHARRALSHARRGEHAEVITDIDAAFDLSPTPLGDDPVAPYHHRLYRARGKALLATGEIARAISDFGEEIAHAPRYAQGHLNRAAAYLANGDEASAMADFTDAIELEEYRAEGYVGRGSIYLERGDLDRALADFDEAIRRRTDQSQTAPAYRQRGIVLEQQGDEAGARAAFAAALELDPDDSVARAGLERVRKAP